MASLPQLCRLSALLVLGVASVSAAPISADRSPVGGWKPGIPGGIPKINQQFCNVRTSIPGSSLKAVGDGVTDDAPAINAAINACPANQYVYIPAGNYRLNSPLGRVGVNNWDYVEHPFSVVIRGDGPAATHLLNYSNGGDIVVFGHTGGATAKVTVPYKVGDTSLTLDSMPYIYPGRWVSVHTDDATAGLMPNMGGYMYDCMTQWAKVTAVNGNVVTLDRPMRWAYGNTVVEIKFSCPVRCGIENLSMERKVNATGNNIHFVGGYECWVRNVESIRPTKWNIRFEHCGGCEVRECIVHDVWDGGGDSGYGVGIWATTGETLVENNVAYRCRHSFITEWGGQGNVFGYNYSFDPINENQLSTDYLMGDLIQHGGDPRWNLWEGNVAATIRFDSVLGSSHYLTAYRNQIQRKGLPPVKIALLGSDVQKWNYYANLVGNVYQIPPLPDNLRRWGSDGDNTSVIDPLSQSTAYLHGEVDLTAGTTTWDSGNADHNLPASLYLTAKPTWWDNGPWPAIGPDVSTKAGGNPALRRFSASPLSSPIPAPTGFRWVQ